MMKKLSLVLLILSLFAAVSAQTKTKRNVRPTAKPAAAPTPAPTPTPEPQIPSTEKNPQKKNVRDDVEIKPAAIDKTKIEDAKIYYRYEFAQPNFLIKKMIIEHDEAGRGRITFEEKNFESAVTDDLQLSAQTVEKLNKLFNTLNFLDATGNYQSPVRNYAHLGTKKILFRRDGKERAVEFNWSENTDARALGEEYAKLGYQLVWESDMKAARENQPLQTPDLVNALESYLQRNEISDPPQMLPLLKELSNDERLPLLARNHILRLIAGIEKSTAKK